MKNLKTITAVALGSLLLGAMTNSFAMSAMNVANAKIAVVDVPAVVASSAEVNSLKESQKLKIRELADFVKNAKADVAAASDASKKKALEDKYNKELNVRKQKIDADYANSLSNIEKNISGVISKKAKDDNYQIVLSKGIVLYGGDDITNAVKKLVK